MSERLWKKLESDFNIQFFWDGAKHWVLLGPHPGCCVTPQELFERQLQCIVDDEVERRLAVRSLEREEDARDG